MPTIFIAAADITLGLTVKELIGLVGLIGVGLFSAGSSFYYLARANISKTLAEASKTSLESMGSVVAALNRRIADLEQQLLDEREMQELRYKALEASIPAEVEKGIAAYILAKNPAGPR